MRSYIGPRTLAAVLTSLLRLGAGGAALPDILNLAAPGAVAMEDLLRADGRRWDWRPAPAGAIAQVVLDTTRLQGLVDLPPLRAGGPANAQAMIREWRSLGNRRRDIGGAGA